MVEKAENRTHLDSSFEIVQGSMSFFCPLKLYGTLRKVCQKREKFCEVPNEVSIVGAMPKKSSDGVLVSWAEKLDNGSGLRRLKPYTFAAHDVA